MSARKKGNKKGRQSANPLRKARYQRYLAEGRREKNKLLNIQRDKKRKKYHVLKKKRRELANKI